MTSIFNKSLLPVLGFGALSLMAACGQQEPNPLDAVSEETGVPDAFGAVPDDGKADGVANPAAAAGVATEVWAVRNQWNDTTTAAARAAGVAWAADSGLDWEAKFDLWVASLRRIPAENGYSTTIEVTTPYGARSFPAPSLECAEFGVFLRVTFASWYHLPFYLRGSDGRQTIFAGHFGFITANGARFANFPRFRTAYSDYEASWREGQPWKEDTRLRAMNLGANDEVPFIEDVNGQTARAGAYFDEMFLNKRVGYFMRLLLLYFDSINLADGANMFHVQAEAIAPGDVLLERWQRVGIGHTIPVMRVEHPDAMHVAPEVATGSMPRRQPHWDTTASASHYFTSNYTGGVGMTFDGAEYAKLGGGIRRWRTAALVGGKWANTVRELDRAVHIADSDVAAIAARPARFEEILLSLTAEEKRDAAIGLIESARMHLRETPASCSARTNREDAFKALYELAPELETSASEIDAQYRTLEDYVFAELQYAASKTCCWNSTTAAMADIVLDYARAEQASATAQGMCVEPTVFRANGSNGGYELYRTHAISLGREADWRAWSEDEPCAQRDVEADTVLTTRAPAAWCTISHAEPVG
ncbi:MAG: hypothetical protein IPK60_19710 [Sandaracinaceae bacterium]|nr:hypothetical protein [Sandaracinaceae bacterium]